MAAFWAIRATTRLTGAAKNTVSNLLLDLGEACSAYQDEALRNLHCERIQVDEIWSFAGCKNKNLDPERHDVGWGDAWTFVAIDADTKLVPSWLVGQRNTDDAVIVLDDMRSRLTAPVQLSTDGHRSLTKDRDPCFSEGTRLPTAGTGGLWLSRTWVFPLRNQGQVIHRAPPPSVRAAPDTAPRHYAVSRP